MEQPSPSTSNRPKFDWKFRDGKAEKTRFFFLNLYISGLTEVVPLLVLAPLLGNNLSGSFAVRMRRLDWGGWLRLVRLVLGRPRGCRVCGVRILHFVSNYVA